ncbi:glycosyltransferase family 2 protein [Pseudoblastomonas halimionae]|uniref:Glycosyltransferase n=1 Tax=Alteriqipengyuania halimionae TaxID=1926630 RepID=A0A6I4U398_9SPHN|nr:glycosyltransferase family 2 protein [Alteriqipengyuania halimionae]MXP10398.1 glycosyltransferase [Alteriqipengyuania halimionae]
MTNPKMSVVMPVYNVEAYVAEAIQSVLAQTFTDFELIIVDDGGQDGSMDIVRSFYDKRIRIVTQSNRGLAGARNTGIAEARAPYIALLDSDDRWHPEKLRLHYVHLEADKSIGVSFSGSRMIDQSGNKLAVAMRPKLTGIRTEDIFRRNPVGNGSAPVLRRSAIDLAMFSHPEEPSRKCWFDEDFRQSEDIDLWMRLSAAHGVRFEGIAGELTKYRIVRGALSANIVKQYLSWTRMLDKAKLYAPDLVEQHGDSARAYQLRYLARRAVQLGNVELAADLFGQAIRLEPRMLVAEPIKSATTAGAVMAAKVLGPERFRAISQIYLKDAAA